MMDAKAAQWTQEQCDALNRYQHEGRFHPYTCGNDRADTAHREYADKHGDPDWGLLVATPDGWRCPVCDYRQSTAWPLP